MSFRELAPLLIPRFTQYVRHVVLEVTPLYEHFVAPEFNRVCSAVGVDGHSLELHPFIYSLAIVLGLYCFWQYLLLVFIFIFLRLALEKAECPICCEIVSAYLMVANVECGDKCCRNCIVRYLGMDVIEKISKLRRARMYNIKCFGGCNKLLDQKISAQYADSVAFRDCLSHLAERARLISK